MSQTLFPSIADFLHEKNVLCHLEARTRDEAIAEILNCLHRHEGGFDLQEAYSNILLREQAGATLILPGVALPHARLDALDGLKLAVGLSAQGLLFNGPDNDPVRVIFLILTPKTDPGVSLRFMAGLSRRLATLKDIRLLVGCSTPSELCGLLAGDLARLPPFLSASHVMNPKPVTVLESDSVARVLDLFGLHGVMDLPVVDEQGDLRGVVSLEDLLSLSLPEHLRWVEDLTPILQFEPFADLLRKDEETRVSDFMREDPLTVPPDVPAIQLARLFLAEGARQIVVLEGRKLAGVVTLSGFIAKLFWA